MLFLFFIGARSWEVHFFLCDYSFVRLFICAIVYLRGDVFVQ